MEKNFLSCLAVTYGTNCSSVSYGYRIAEESNNQIIFKLCSNRFSNKIRLIGIKYCYASKYLIDQLSNEKDKTTFQKIKLAACKFPYLHTVQRGRSPRRAILMRSHFLKHVKPALPYCTRGAPLVFRIPFLLENICLVFIVILFPLVLI